MNKAMGVYKRGESWYVRWRQHGRLIRKSLGPEVTTRAQAEAVWRELKKRRREGNLGLLDPSQIRLGQFREEYITHRRPLGLSPHTIRLDDLALRSLAEMLGDNCLLRNINQRRVEGWAGVLLGRGNKPHTVNAYLRHIKAALNVAVEWGQLAKAPKLKKVREPKAVPKHLTPDQLSRLLRAESDPDRRRLWVFFVWTGARRQEVVDLAWQDVYLDEKPYALFTGKGRKQRIVPLMPPAVEALGQRQDLGSVFSVKPDTISHWFKATARAAGLEHVRLHDLRHTAATYMISRGISIRMVQEILGHANISTTERYTKALIADLYDEMTSKMG